jgi:hypothetical protein
MARRIRIGILVSISVILLCAGAFAQAAEKPTIYVYVGWWDVPREKWAAFVQDYEKNEMPVMDRLVDEGILTEYGLDASGLHNPDGYSHSTWMVSTSTGNLERALDAYYASAGADADRMEAEFATLIKKHMDGTFQSDHYGTRPAKLSKGYFNSSSIRVKRGKSDDFVKLWETWAQPVFEQLLADGTIVSYGLDTPLHHTSADSLGQMVTWYVLENMDQDSKVDAAFEAAREKLSGTERAGRNGLYWSLVHEDSHRDDFTRLIHFRTK